MCRKCNPHTDDFKGDRRAPQRVEPSAWRILNRLSGDLYVLSQTRNDQVKYAPLFMHSFALCAPRKILEATQFNQRYRSYEEIDNVPDRLRWLRHSRGLMQVEVAKLIGVSVSTYKSMEKGRTHRIPQARAERLAQLFDVPAIDFWNQSN